MFADLLTGSVLLWLAHVVSFTLIGSQQVGVVCFRVQSVLCGIVQQACEKIDRTRCVAGRTLFHFLHTLRPPLLHVPCREMLECVIPR